jgi:uncharacterized membrane protein YbhN (UPF0104 family)
MSDRTRKDDVALPPIDQPIDQLTQCTASATSQSPVAHRARHGQLLHRVHRAVDPSILLPLVIALGLLAYVSYLAAAPQGGTQLWSIVRHTWLLVVILIALYLAARLLVWYVLLGQLGIAVPWRQVTVAFAAGEITKSLPAGVYLQNYLLGRLSRLGRLSVVRSTVATTAMLGLESLLAVPLVLLIGLPGAPWARVTLLGIVLGWIALLLLAWLLVRYRATRPTPRTVAWRRRLVLLTEEFLAASRELIAPRTVRALGPTALYMFLYAIVLYAILQAAGVHTVSFEDTLGLYAVLVLAVILVPIPTELGITEFTGLGALLAYGIPGPTAAIVMLSFRVLATGATILVGGALLVLMRHELVSTASAERLGGEVAACQCQ